MEGLTNLIASPELNNRYLALFNDVVIHRTPSGGYIYKGKVEINAFFDVNRTGMLILSRCDGTVTIRDLIENFAREMPGEVEHITKGIPAFVTEASHKGLIRLLEIPTTIPIRVTGHTQYYYPIHVMIELTQSCNLFCKHCYRDSGPQHFPRLPTQRLLNILDQIAHNGGRVVELTGGEPLMHLAFLTILDFCGERFSLIAVLSNGTLITGRHADRMAHHRDKLLVQVDLDGVQPEVHDAFRGRPGAFERAKRAIRLLAERGIRVRVAMTIIPQNLDDIEATLLLAKKLGAALFTCTTMVEAGRGGQHMDLLLSPEQIRRLIETLRRIEQEYPDFYFRPPERYRKRLNCGAGYHSCTIGPTGIVRPCPLIPEDFFVLGNLDNESYEQVFSNPLIGHFAALRAPCEELCQGCRFALYCRSCLYKAMNVRHFFQRGESCQWAAATGTDHWLVTDGQTQVTSATICRRDYVFD